MSGRLRKQVGEAVEKVFGDSLSNDSFVEKLDRLLRSRADQILTEQKLGKMSRGFVL